MTDFEFAIDSKYEKKPKFWRWKFWFLFPYLAVTIVQSAVTQIVRECQHHFFVGHIVDNVDSIDSVDSVGIFVDIIAKVKKFQKKNPKKTQKCI